MQTLTVPYIMTAGGPSNATYFYTMYLYDNAFRYVHMGYASAMAWIQLLIILSLTGIAFPVGEAVGALWVNGKQAERQEADFVPRHGVDLRRPSRRVHRLLSSPFSWMVSTSLKTTGPGARPGVPAAAGDDRELCGGIHASESRLPCTLCTRNTLLIALLTVIGANAFQFPGGLRFCGGTVRGSSDCSSA